MMINDELDPLDFALINVEQWTETAVIYRAAIQELITKLNILDSEYKLIHQYNPIEHIKSRIKMPKSIVKKLNNKALEPTLDNALTHLQDIAGVRVVCSFIEDIYFLQDVLTRQSDITVITVKDYIEKPKSNGYRSLHMIISLPVFLSVRTIQVPIELQIRTVAMDTWASLEHKLNYKYANGSQSDIEGELFLCAKLASQLDEKMQAIKHHLTYKGE